MTDKIEAAARDAAAMAALKKLHQDNGGYVFGMKDGFREGYLAGHSSRDEEVAALRARVAELEEDASLYRDYVRRNPPAGMPETKPELPPAREEEKTEGPRST